MLTYPTPNFFPNTAMGENNHSFTEVVKPNMDKFKISGTVGTVLLDKTVGYNFILLLLSF